MPRRPYPWPSRLLDAETMHRLMLHRGRSGERISKAVRRAVDELLDASEEAAARESQRVAEGNGEYPGTPSSAVHRDDPYTERRSLREGHSGV